MGLRSRPQRFKDAEDAEHMAPIRQALSVYANNHLRIVVVGGRVYADREATHAVPDRIHTQRIIAELVQDGSPGAASLATGSECLFASRRTADERRDKAL